MDTTFVLWDIRRDKDKTGGNGALNPQAGTTTPAASAEPEYHTGQSRKAKRLNC